MAKSRADWKGKNKEARKDFKKDGKQRPGRAMNRGQAAQKDLGLNADQQKKMEQMRADFRNKFSSLRSDNSLTADQKKLKMQEMRKQQQEQMKSILTPEQIQKMESARQDRTRKNS